MRLEVCHRDVLGGYSEVRVFGCASPKNRMKFKSRAYIVQSMRKLCMRVVRPSETQIIAEYN